MAEYNDYKKRLHRIILHSADILPKEVLSYLLSNSPWFEVKRDILSKPQDYKPLVDHIPSQFVDFVLDFIIKTPRIEIDYEPYFLEVGDEGWYAEVGDEGWSNNLGISDKSTFLPATPIQGPFLYLLNTNEEEGLRLVHTLVNVAIERWRHQPQIVHPDQPELIPVPVTLQLPSELHDFWGDIEVYCWFRGKSTEPNLVMSALMALEVWMETQIEAGRDAEELFEKILVKSDCVAVPGICLGIALAYPEKCLKAALPIVSSPMIWKMDISRSTTLDILGTFRFDYLDGNKLMYDILEKRDKKTQRTKDIRSLAVMYMHSTDNNIKSIFQQAVEKFTLNLPFFTKGDQDNPEMIFSLKEDVKKIQIYSDLKNYRQFQAANYVEIIVEPPEEIRKRHESALSFSSEWHRWLKVCLWVERTIEKGSTDESMTLEEAITFVKEFHQLEAVFQEGDEDDIRKYTCLQTIVGAAVAALITDFEWAQNQNLIEWSRNVFLAAVRLSKSSTHAASSSKIKVYAGRGLALLVSYGIANAEVRLEILQLIGNSLRPFSNSREAVKAVFLGLKKAWNIDVVLCWNALGLCLSLSLIPGKLYYKTQRDQYGNSYNELKTWEDNIIQSYLNYLAKDEISDLPRIAIARNIAFVHKHVQYGLCALPLTELCRDSDTKQKLLQLCDGLLARTIADNLPIKDKPFSHPQPSLIWNQFILNWAAYLALSLNTDEIRQHILTPLRDNWSQAPRLTADLLNGYICHQIAYTEGPNKKALETWQEICNWVLSSSEIVKVACLKYLDNETEEILQLIIFNHHGEYYIKGEWQHANLFIYVFDKWVTVVGHNPDAYTHLLTMLDGIGWLFAPEPTLEWLNRCASKAVHDLWNEQRGNGRRTAELLNRIWNSFEQRIRNDKVILQHYSNLVYRLVEAGIPLASMLQQKLEKRG
ncbi:hypothetical protein [Trichocoleus sp. DQ-U1]|uniref:hypothetical protein n=1 Tax=Trichocoleus sp. DQ-U1 TaxID=2933926 RepID=UPI003297FF64